MYDTVGLSWFFYVLQGEPLRTLEERSLDGDSLDLKLTRTLEASFVMMGLGLEEGLWVRRAGFLNELGWMVELESFRLIGNLK